MPAVSPGRATRAGTVGAMTLDLTAELVKEASWADICNAMKAAAAGPMKGVLAYTDVVRELGGFDPEFHHFADWDLWQRLAMRGPCAVLPAPLLGYTRHPSASTLLGNKYDDVELVERKHADARRERGAASPRPGLLMWIGEMALRVNDKAAARKAYREAIKLDPSWRTRARRVFAEVPRYIDVLDKLKQRAIPKDVLADSLRWLNEVDLRNPF